MEGGHRHRHNNVRKQVLKKKKKEITEMNDNKEKSRE